MVPKFAWNGPLISPVFLKRSLVFPTLLFSSVYLYCSLMTFLALLAILWNSAFSWVYLFLSPLPFTCLLFCYLQGFLRQPLCLLWFLFLWNGLGHHLLYNVMIIWQTLSINNGNRTVQSCVLKSLELLLFMMAIIFLTNQMKNSV